MARALILSAVIAFGGCKVQQETVTVAPDGTRGGEAPPPPAIGVQSGAGATAHPVGILEIRDEASGKVFRVHQGPPGDPAVKGCADGQREAFVEDAAFPNIAGCLAEWQGNQSMRAPGSGVVCGDDARNCGAPADACASGWHLCGASGSVQELRNVTAEQCSGAGGGRFSAAISHCLSQEGCEVDRAPSATYECFASGWCSEPVCCGEDCGDFGACRDGVWPGATHIPVGMDQGCGAVAALRAGGVLCCR